MPDPLPSHTLLSTTTLARPLTLLLRPLVRLLVRSGMTFPQCAELLRGLYVDVASRDLLDDPRDRTDSRISLLTGVHRKHLRSLRESGVPVHEEPLNSQIMSRWRGTARFLDPHNQPRRLPRLPQPDDAPSFESLVRSVTTDLRARAVLDEWIRQGIVALEPDDHVVLRDASFLLRPGQDAAACANVARLTDEAPFLDRSVHYDRLSPASVALLEQEGRAAAKALLVEIDRRALALAEAEDAAGLDPAAPTRRFNLGVYLYVEDEPPALQGADP
jgi:hypothetical protein